MNRKNISKLSLSNYSLISQIIIINLITAIIGFIFVGFFNIFFLKNNKNIKIKIDQINNQINDITNHLENNAIFKIRQININTGVITFSSKPQLDPHASQLYVEKKYLNQSNEIKIYNSDSIKFVDTKDLYTSEDVLEMGIDSFYQKPNFLDKYKEFYISLFNYLQIFFDRYQMKEIIESPVDDSNLISETIKKRIKIFKIFLHENNTLSFNIVNPLKSNNNIYGFLMVRSYLTQKNNESALISYNLFNLYLIIVLLMFLLSIIFTRSIIRPIKTLSLLARYEQNKFKLPSTKLKYPIRNDEIGGLSNDIKNMSTELTSQINELEKFAADVSHELKNPITSLKSSNELLSENKISQVNRKILFNNITKELDHMNKLITDISEYTRTQAEIEKQKFDEFELNKFINDLVNSFPKNKKNIIILFDSSNLEVIVQTNKDKLAQVFINLIDNAISFSPKESKILIKLIKEASMVKIFLIDQGIGIEEKLKIKIFERFYTDRIEKNDYHSGLGLSISKKIIESLGGSLEISDKLFKGYNGACFKLKLPIKG